MAKTATPIGELEQSIRKHLREKFEAEPAPVLVVHQPPPGPRPRVPTPDVVIIDYADIRRGQK